MWSFLSVLAATAAALAFQSSTAAALDSVARPQDYDCDNSVNFIRGVKYSQISLTDGCTAGGVCNNNPKYVPEYGSDLSTDAGVEYCKTRCNDANTPVTMPETVEVGGKVEVTSCEPVWNTGQNFFGIKRDFYLDNMKLFKVGAPIVADGTTYYIDAMNLPKNCNRAVALVYVANKVECVDGTPWAHTPECGYGGELTSDLSVDVNWHLPAALEASNKLRKRKHSELPAKRSSCTGFFFQRHTNGHEICGFYTIDLNDASLDKVRDGHSEGSRVCVKGVVGDTASQDSTLSVLAAPVKEVPEFPGDGRNSDEGPVDALYHPASSSDCPTPAEFKSSTTYPVYASSTDNYWNYCNYMVTADCGDMCADATRGRCRNECNKHMHSP